MARPVFEFLTDTAQQSDIEADRLRLKSEAGLTDSCLIRSSDSSVVGLR